MHSTLHQLAVGLRVSEKTLLGWNKSFGIATRENEAGQLIYDAAEKELVLRIHYLIKERGFSIGGAKKELKKKPLDEQRDATIKRLSEIRAFLSDLRKEL